MNFTPNVGARTGFAWLRQMAQPRAEVEQCEFCASALAPEHRHLVDVATRKLICACDPCALRFENVIGRWKLVPRSPRFLTNFQMADADWDALALPINLAFFVNCTPAGRVVALYPSPGGQAEAQLDASHWSRIVAANSCLETIEADVEALLVNRLGEAREYYLVPIDTCFELVGLLRVHWRGLAGGERVWAEFRKFFDHLKLRAKTVGTEAQPEVVHA